MNKVQKIWRDLDWATRTSIENCLIASATVLVIMALAIGAMALEHYGLVPFK